MADFTRTQVGLILALPLFMTHLTLQLETGIYKATREEAIKAVQWGFDADNILNWVFCAVVGKRQAAGLSTGKRVERKMYDEAARICKEGSKEVLDCRVSMWLSVRFKGWNW